MGELLAHLFAHQCRILRIEDHVRGLIEQRQTADRFAHEAQQQLGLHLKRLLDYLARHIQRQSGEFLNHLFIHLLLQQNGQFPQLPDGLSRLLHALGIAALLPFAVAGLITFIVRLLPHLFQLARGW